MADIGKRRMAIGIVGMVLIFVMGIVLGSYIGKIATRNYPEQPIPTKTK